MVVQYFSIVNAMLLWGLILNILEVTTKGSETFTTGCGVQNLSPGPGVIIQVNTKYPIEYFAILFLIAITVFRSIL